MVFSAVNHMQMKSGRSSCSSMLAGRMESPVRTGVLVHHREVSDDAPAHDAGVQPAAGTAEHSPVAALHRFLAVDLDGHCLMVAVIADVDELGQVSSAGQVANSW